MYTQEGEFKTSYYSVVASGDADFIHCRTRTGRLLSKLAKTGAIGGIFDGKSEVLVLKRTSFECLHIEQRCYKQSLQRNSRHFWPCTTVPSRCDLVDSSDTGVSAESEGT